MKAMVYRLLAATLVATAFSSGAVFAQSASTPDLTGNWLVTVAGESRTRTLIISGEAPTSDGALLQAKYGMSDENQGPISAEMKRVNQQRQLILTTQANTKITVTEQPDGQFKGSFALKNGTVKDVVISRPGEAVLVAAAKPAASLVQKPGPDVPANCAAFSGGWSGEWPNVGQSYFWVARISSDCSAQVVYTRSSAAPKNASGLSAATIKGNTLTWSRPDGGTTMFEMKGEVLHGFYRGPSGENKAVLQRIDPTTSAQIDQELKAALASVPPGPNVPADCAGYYGNWGGNWSQGQQGEWYLRVAEVRSSGDGCVVRYSYAPSKGPFPAKETAEIKRGSITFVCNRSTGGTCVFTRQGEVLTASYTNPAGGSNNATFKRVE